nr:uncharacterized mitochondrial protein AtMg00810-like [Tanacetum cinerariifolium]
PKECHLYVVKRIFRYLKGHPKLGLWYPKESPFDLVAYSNSDYSGATQDRKSTTGGCQFLGRRLISWQCKKQTIVATSITEAEYVAAASGYGQVLLIQNQMLDYGIKITDQETKIIATVDGKPRTISESSLRRHLKLKTVLLFASMIVTQGEGLANPTEPHHTPLPQEHQSPQSDYSPQHDSPPLSHQSIIPEPIPHDLQAPTETLTPRRLTKRAICLQRQQSQMADKIKDQDIKISGLKARVKSLKDKERRCEEPIQEDAPITGGIIDIGEELGADKSTEKGSNDTEEIVNVLSLIEAVNILSSGGAAFSTASVSPTDVFPTAAFSTASVSPADVFPTAGVPTVSGSFPTVCAIFTTASVITPYTRRSRGLDRSNEVIAKHLSEYEQAEADLSVREKIELITEETFEVAVGLEIPLLSGTSALQSGSF